VAEAYDLLANKAPTLSADKLARELVYLIAFIFLASVALLEYLLSRQPADAHRGSAGQEQPSKPALPSVSLRNLGNSLGAYGRGARPEGEPAAMQTPIQAPAPQAHDVRS